MYYCDYNNLYFFNKLAQPQQAIKASLIKVIIFGENNIVKARIKQNGEITVYHDKYLCSDVFVTITLNSYSNSSLYEKCCI